MATAGAKHDEFLDRLRRVEAGYDPSRRRLAKDAAVIVLVALAMLAGFLYGLTL
jgi:hypothetical protein